MKRAVIHLRISTTGPTTENQRRELETVATQRGWRAVTTYKDAGINTGTPSGRAMFQMLGVFAEFERAMIRERVNAGLARARIARRQSRPRCAKAPRRRQRSQVRSFPFMHPRLVGLGEDS